jgi:hypothetical protein
MIPFKKLIDTVSSTLSRSDFSFMEILPKPLGVMTVKGRSLSPQSASVALAGLASGFSGLIVGETYYTTTSGKVITDGAFYGQSATTATDAALEGYFYVDDVVDKVIVSADSVLGLAIASDTILLKLA